MTLNVACVQYTAGESEEAAQSCLHESHQTLQVLDALNCNDVDRVHMTNVICGDFNNVHDEDACVQLMRELFFFTHNIVGGPRWATWLNKDTQASARYQKYYACNCECFESTNAARRAQREVAKYARKPSDGRRTATSADHAEVEEVMENTMEHAGAQAEERELKPATEKERKREKRRGRGRSSGRTHWKYGNEP
ncbi:hypothetical protein TraAM80_01607 [Trypanosoma rangeli]|uniref:Uncharacterized protein n=1 Tax=Trypanosoma rangeli TaxID=5698 RepID=A0A3R7MSA4_TRYRA|nr:uncharacterized protein TraAM80_01607 [Trypanosoma rangeli]RNF10434.1 hypothetical protein TraAM80_01607 [Trypanosoma rangeli]|eukprot:RNF10434.1 hypothetical protein TraAM80_01607 [Trypanosoma rangeli]